MTAPEITRDEFNDGIAALHQRLSVMGQLALGLVEEALVAFYACDVLAARAAMIADDEIDRIDVEIEQQAVELLTQAAATSITVAPATIRQLLTVVKVNNEVERMADAGGEIAALAAVAEAGERDLPATTRVMTNSVVGLMRDAMRAFARQDADVARVVLASEHVVEGFKTRILRTAEQRVATGAMSVDAAFNLQELVSHCMFIADHCTNIAEQVIYMQTGLIVRHTDEQWVERPGAEEP